MTTPIIFQSTTELKGNGNVYIPFNPYDLQCIALAHSILCKNPMAKMSNRELAMEVGINRNKLHYGFKYMYGLTITHFLEQQRMLKAEFLLTTTYKPVKMIAAHTGYCTSSRFCTVFKKTYGVTPYQYRKQVWITARNVNSCNREQAC